MSDYRHHFSPPPQSDQQAASSAFPDTDPQPYGDDPAYQAYVGYLESIARYTCPDCDDCDCEDDGSEMDCDCDCHFVD